MEPWSADDPWQERRDPSPGWDEWPPPAPSADDYAVEQAAPPASDPWAESWADEVPGIPTSPPPELESESQPAPDAGYEPSAAPAFEPPKPHLFPASSRRTTTEAKRVAEAESAEAESAEAEPQPFVDAEPAMAPRIEPWSPDSDPWGAAWTVPPVVEAAPDEEPVADEDVAEEQVVDEPVAEEQVAEEQVAEEQVAEEQVAEEQVAEESRCAPRSPLSRRPRSSRGARARGAVDDEPEPRRGARRR